MSTEVTKATKELESMPLIGQTGCYVQLWLAAFVAFPVVMQAIVFFGVLENFPCGGQWRDLQRLGCGIKLR